MAVEQFSNAGVSTLNGQVLAGTPGTSGTIVVSNAASFPPQPQFRLSVDTGTNQEIMLVTGVSGTTFTVTRGAEGIGGNAASAPLHQTGVSVIHLPTAGAMAGFPQLATNNTFTGTNTFQSVLAASVQTTGSVSELSGTGNPTQVLIGLAGSPRIQFAVNGSTTWEVDNSSGTFRIYQPGVAKFSITSAGLTGVGNGPSPAAWLHVLGDNATTTLFVETTGGTPWAMILRRTDLGAASDVKIANSGSTFNINGAIQTSSGATVGGNLSVTGTSSHTGNATFSGTVSMSSTLSVSSTATVGNLTVSGGPLSSSSTWFQPSWGGSVWNGTTYQSTIGWGNQARQLFTANTRNDTYAVEGDILFNV